MSETQHFSRHTTQDKTPQEGMVNILTQRQPGPLPAETTSESPQTPSPYSRNLMMAKLQQLLMYVYSIISILLMFRFVLSLVGASRTTPFVSFIYQLTVPFMLPFENMFGTPLGIAQYRLEFEVLVALLVYALIFLGVAKLVSIIFG